MKKYYGWKHKHGPLNVFELHSWAKLAEKRQYQFIDKFVEPFDAENMEEALEHIILVTK